MFVTEEEGTNDGASHDSVVVWMLSSAIFCSCMMYVMFLIFFTLKSRRCFERCSAWKKGKPAVEERDAAVALELKDIQTQQSTNGESLTDELVDMRFGNPLRSI